MRIRIKLCLSVAQFTHLDFFKATRKLIFIPPFMLERVLCCWVIGRIYIQVLEKWPGGGGGGITLFVTTCFFAFVTGWIPYSITMWFIYIIYYIIYEFLVKKMFLKISLI